jgi:hypothetical protein
LKLVVHPLDVDFRSEKSEGNRSVGRPRQRWNYKMNLKEIGCGDMD